MRDLVLSLASRSFDDANEDDRDHHRSSELIWIAVSLDLVGEPAQAQTLAIQAVESSLRLGGGFGRAWFYVEAAAALGKSVTLATSPVLWQAIGEALERDETLGTFLSNADDPVRDNVTLLLRAAFAVAGHSDRTTFYFTLGLLFKLGVPVSTDLLRKITAAIVGTDGWLLL